MCAKQSTRSFLVLLLFPSLIFSPISPAFTLIEVPTPIFFLSHFASFLLFVIVPTGKLLVDLGEVIGDCGSNSRVCCQTVFSFPTKNKSQQKTAQALRTKNSSLRKSYHTSPQDLHEIPAQLQSYLFKIVNELTYVYM